MLIGRVKGERPADQGGSLLLSFHHRIMDFFLQSSSLRIIHNTMFNRIWTVTTVFLLAGFLVLPAHGQKIGYANQEALLANMPEMNEVQRQLQQEAQQQQKELQQEQQQLQKEMKQYQQQQSLLSDSAQSQREQELRQRQQELQKSSQQRQQQLRKREQELMQPLLEELQTAIETVSDRENLDLVLRSQALLDVRESAGNVVNISPQIAQELGIELQEAPSEPSPTVDPQQQQQPGGPPAQGGGGQ